MIEIHVCTDSAVSGAFAEKNSLAADSVILAASEGGSIVGFIALNMHYPPIDSQEDIRVDITALEYDDDFVGELMVRAAVSYGERRGAVVSRALCSDPAGALVRTGYADKDGVMQISVSSVVHTCRNCAENGK